LQAIQREIGYLRRDKLEEAARTLEVSPKQLQQVASFYPLFRLEEPKKVTISVCRDMACHINGAPEIIQRLKALGHADVEVKGMSCPGRCDRPPAACVALQGHEHEGYYLQRSADDLVQIVKQCLANPGKPPAPDLDIDHPTVLKVEEFEINPYRQPASGETDAAEAKEIKPLPPFAGVKRVLDTRARALKAAEDRLINEGKWTPNEAQEFSRAVVERVDPQLLEEGPLRARLYEWITDIEWPKGLELGSSKIGDPRKRGPKRLLGNWSDVMLAKLRFGRLRGMGGAGADLAGKLRDVRNELRKLRGRRVEDTRGFIVVNGDESEPSTFKDRELLLRTAHLIVEGVIIAGLLTEATQGFIFIRHEYTEQIAACREAIREAEKLKLCGNMAGYLGRRFPVEVFPSPGGYICGEQSALIEAMSDHRSEPRPPAPTLATNGLQNQPTVVSNVETYAWIPLICIKGGRAYADMGQKTPALVLPPPRAPKASEPGKEEKTKAPEKPEDNRKGRRLFSVCGDVVRPGVYEVPIGLPLRELIHGENYCRGIREGRQLKAIATSGPSGGFVPETLTASDTLAPEYKRNNEWRAFTAAIGRASDVTEFSVLDLWLEINLFRGVLPSAMLGAGLCVYDETRNMVDQAVNYIEFYRNESCGKCVPCRLGTQKLAALGSHLLAGEIDQSTWNEQILPAVGDLHTAMKQTSICGLGMSVPNAFIGATTGFPGDFDAYFNKATPNSI
jgi:NADH:ubiquinone oxidoreductase subunit F (NADH-binding)/NADH:ubiquinone oxidoreductase subunit E